MRKHPLGQDFIATAAATSVFYTSVSLGQSVQFALGINTGRPVIAAAASFLTLASGLLLSWETGDALCGCTDRCASSIRASTRAIPRAFAVKIDEATAAVDRQLSVTRNFVSRLGTGVYPEISVLRSSGPEFWRRWRSKEDKTLSRTAVVLSGLLLFGALGGRRLSLTPSNVRSIGAFARQEGSFPATMAYASAAQRKFVAEMGHRFGCHTCGTRQSLRVAGWVADHQPARKYAREANMNLWRRLTGRKIKQRFFPHCKACSIVQSAAVRSRSSPAVVTHHLLGQHNPSSRAIKGFLGSVRAYHLTGGVLVGAAVSFDHAADSRGSVR
mmetsp:Transcript_43866/g.99158  ORF Transcript_43866/g.99158 Transcript_43866/m.99158 type:complete len:328 (+) Transcript_43866:107-1090(+)